MPLRVEPGAEYRGEVYIFCDSHVTYGYSNSCANGAIFDGTSRAELAGFIAEHADCGETKCPRCR